MEKNDTSAVRETEEYLCSMTPFLLIPKKTHSLDNVTDYSVKMQMQMLDSMLDFLVG